MDTIAAPITPLVVSPIIVVRVSGNKALDVFSLMEKKNGKDFKPVPNQVSRYIFNIKEENLHDDVLAVFFKKPYSFTGEDVVEISFHGNPVLVTAALNSIYSLGIRSAMGGEFSKQAFLNGKIDLTQAESIQELIFAKSLDGINSAYNQLKGNLKNELINIKNKLLNMKAIVEAKIDFPDEDTVDEEVEILKNSDMECIKRCKYLIDSYQGYRMSNKGVEIVLAGKPNVGKSSIMNALLKEERVIVSDMAGTTRDFIKENLYLGGYPVLITDTAGIHDTSEAVEKIGVEKSQEKIKSSDIVLLVLDISRPIEEEDRNLLELTKDLNRIIIGNKSDLSADYSYKKCDIYISAKDGDNIDDLLLLLKSKAGMKDSEYQSNIIAITERHRYNLVEINKLLEKVYSYLGVYPLDMVCIDLDRAIRLLEEITGEEYTEKVLDIVFESFCIGK